MSRENEKNQTAPPTYPTNRYYIWSKSLGVYELCENDPQGGTRHVHDLYGRWTTDRRGGVIRPWRPEDDMNFLQRFVSRFRREWEWLVAHSKER